MPVLPALLKISLKPVHLLLHPLLDNLPPLWIAPPCHEMQAASASHSTQQNKPSKGGLFPISFFLRYNSQYANEVKNRFIFSTFMCTQKFYFAAKLICMCATVVHMSVHATDLPDYTWLWIRLVSMHVFLFPYERVCLASCVEVHSLSCRRRGLENRAGKFQIPIPPLNMSRAKLQAQQNSRGSVFLFLMFFLWTEASLSWCRVDFGRSID